MARDIVPISTNRRLPEAGRIRLGEKGPKGNPVKLDTFRFTSHDKQAIDQIASLYGGDVKAWEQGQWEVKTGASDIAVILPPDPLGGTPIYELWSKGGCQRRCDGTTAQVPQAGPDGAEMVDVACICTEKQALECKPTTRLIVVLPDIKFGGGWRLETGGWNAALEMPGMVDAIMQFASRGFTRAHLSLEQRKSVQAGQTRRFVVPVLRPDVSLDALLEGEGGLKALARSPQEALRDHVTGAIERGEKEPIVEQPVVIDTSWEDDTIVDAEIVEDDVDPNRPFTPMQEAADAVLLEVKRKALHASLREIGMGIEERHALAMKASKGRCISSNDLSLDELDTVLKAIKAIRDGKAEYQGVGPDGMAIVVRV